MNLLLNNTSRYHCGSAAAVSAIIDRFGIDESLTLPTGGYKLPRIDWGQYSAVYLNGEGTMHGNAGRAVVYLDLLREAQNAGVETHIVNSVWQTMGHDHDDVLQRCASISVREILSRQEIERHGVSAEIVPDMAYFYPVEIKPTEKLDVVEGQYWEGFERYGRYSDVDIFQTDWQSLVSTLAGAELLITGRHHEMVAACRARCRFLIKSSNTWKMEGLPLTAGAIIPFDIEGALRGDYDREYAKIWSFLAKYE